VAVGDYALYNNTIGLQNTALGWVAGEANTTGIYNTFLGAWAGVGNTSGYNNTFVGLAAGENNTTGYYNTFIGVDAGLNNDNATGNSFFGMESGVENTTGNYNTFGGIYSGFNSRSGSGNTIFGAFSVAGAHIDGDYNDANGYYSLYSLSTGDSNVGMGANSLYNTTTGNANTAFGYNAGYSVTTDNDNLFLGTGADRGVAEVKNAAAIGYNAIVTVNNQMELGNNNQTITMGISGIRPTNSVTRLELNTQNGACPYNVNWTSTPPSYINPGNGGTGWSGLRFDDLKSTSTPGKNPGQGYLALDTAGNVIYVNAVASTTTTTTTNTQYQDSVVLNQTIDSVRTLRTIVDSLRTAFKDIQACLDKLCSGTNTTNTTGTTSTTSATSTTGVSGDNTVNTNTQDITLSSADVPVLYQNIANPFNTFTKINYYLPQGTTGASNGIYRQLW
jgi:hypothetical protein